MNWFPAKKTQWLADPVSAVAPGPMVANVYELRQNYPNPFNPTTQITFSIPKVDNVVLKVYNTLGQEAATLANGVMASGQHTVAFDARNLASGVYFYRLTAGSYVSTMKMMLLK